MFKISVLLRLIYILLVDAFFSSHHSHFFFYYCMCRNLSLNLPHPSLCLPQMSPMIFRFALTRTLLHLSFFITIHPLPQTSPIFLAFSHLHCSGVVYHILQKRTFFPPYIVIVVVDAIVFIVFVIVLLLFLCLESHNKCNKNREPRLLHYFSLFCEHLAFIFIYF